MNTNKTVWVDMTTAPRERVQECFEQERDEILMRIVRLQGEMQSYNENRFSDNPIVISLDFTEQFDKYLGLDEETKLELYNRAFDHLMAADSNDGGNG